MGVVEEGVLVTSFGAQVPQGQVKVADGGSDVVEGQAGLLGAEVEGTSDGIDSVDVLDG